MEAVKGYCEYVTYVLKLEEDRYYVGLTTNLKQRYQQHCAGVGAKWTALYSPVEIIDLYAGDREQEITEKLIAEHGWAVVRGGDYCFIKQLSPKQAKRMLGRMKQRDHKLYSEIGVGLLKDLPPEEPKPLKGRAKRKAKRKLNKNYFN